MAPPGHGHRRIRVTLKERTECVEPSAHPRRIRTIAVIGAGLMGHGIALELAAHGYDVRLFDSNPEQLARAEQRIADSLALLESSGNLTADQRLRRNGVVADAVAGAALVFEAVLAVLVLQQVVFTELVSLSATSAIFASNP